MKQKHLKAIKKGVRQMSSNKKDTPKKERVIISLLLTKCEKEEIIQKLKTETNKEKILDLRKKLQNIDKQIKSLREDLRTYENNIFTAG